MAPVRVAARAERQRVKLGLDGRDHRPVAEPDLVHRVAMEVHVAPALPVLKVKLTGLTRNSQVDPEV
jgi:hypothetical protein